MWYSQAIVQETNVYWVVHWQKQILESEHTRLESLCPFQLFQFGEFNIPLAFLLDFGEDRVKYLEDLMDGGASCSPRGREESDITERLCFHFSLSCIGEGNGNPLHYSCLENPRDGGAWWPAIYGVAQSRTRLKQLSSSSSSSSSKQSGP